MPFTEAQDQVKIKGAWVKGTGTQGLDRCSHQTFHSKGNTKVRQMHPSKQSLTAYLALCLLLPWHSI